MLLLGALASSLLEIQGLNRDIFYAGLLFTTMLPLQNGHAGEHGFQGKNCNDLPARGNAIQVTQLLGIACEVPPHALVQKHACQLMENVMVASMPVTGGDRTRLRKIYAGSGIDCRYTVLPDYLEIEPERFVFFPKNVAMDPFPGTAARMRVYERESIPLATKAARSALEDADIRPEHVTHLIFCTCTGFFAPGPDVLLIDQLGLPPQVNRYCLGFMGCYAGLSGLRLANDIIQGDSSAIVLQVCVELCTLHYQKSTSTDTMIANALFGDGVAAAVYGNGRPATGRSAEILATRSSVSANSLDRMSWRIGDTGFDMTLDVTVPEFLKQAAPEYLAALTNDAGLLPQNVTSWAIHPGGRRILEELGECLSLSRADLESSYSVLRDYGNMSSATILFVLNHELRRKSGPGLLAAMAFGPGLTIEGCLLERK